MEEVLCWSWSGRDKHLHTTLWRGIDAGALILSIYEPGFGPETIKIDLIDSS
jgi:hypothetical protein